MTRSPHLTLAELAERWRCSHSTVLTLARSGQIGAIDIGTGRRAHYIVPLEAVEQYEATRTVRQPAQQQRRRRNRLPQVTEYIT